MVLEIDMVGDEAIYKQIRDQIIIGIASGRIKAGDPLPTVRKLANELGVNPMTVNKAYGLLRDTNAIDIDRRHGAVVKSLTKQTSAFDDNSILKMKVLISEAKVKGIELETIQDTFKECLKEIYEGVDS